MIAAGGCRGELRSSVVSSAEFGCEFGYEFDWGVPKGDCSGMGMVTEVGFVEDFVGFQSGGSSILGIVGSCVMRHELLFLLMNGYLAEEFQFGT